MGHMIPFVEPSSTSPLFDSPIFDDLTLAQQLSAEFSIRDSVSKSQGDPMTSWTSSESSLSRTSSSSTPSSPMSSTEFPSSTKSSGSKRGLKGSSKGKRKDKSGHRDSITSPSISKRPTQFRIPLHPMSLFEEQESLGLALTLHSQCLSRTKVEDFSSFHERLPEGFLDGSFRSYEQLALALNLLLDSPVLLDAFQKAFREKFRLNLALTLPSTNLPPILPLNPIDPNLEKAQKICILVHQFGCKENEDFEQGFTRETLESFSDTKSIEDLISEKFLVPLSKGKFTFSQFVTAPFSDLASFLLRQPSHRIRSRRLEVSQIPEVPLNELHLPFFRSLNSRLLERFAKLVTEKGNFLHTIDLSFSNVTPSMLLPLLRQGRGLTSLTLKGCDLLEDTKTFEILSRYCSKSLRHFGPWEGISGDSLSFLLGKLENISYLDLSYCRNVTAALFESLGDLVYLNLSNLDCPLEKRAFRTWLSRYGKRLEALFLVPSKDRHQGEWCDDTLIASIAQYCSSSFRVLDLTYSLDLTESSIESLAKCTSLELLRFSGDLKSSLEASSQSLVTLLRSLPHLQHFEIEKTETHDLTEVFSEIERGNHTFQSLTFQGLFLPDNFSRALLVHAPYLTKLNLCDCELTCTDTVGRVIAKCTNLVDLQIKYCRKLSRAVLVEIVTSCLDLVVLGLSGCAVTDDLLRALLVDLSALDRIRRRALHTLLIARCKFLTDYCLDSLCSAQHLAVLRLRACEFLFPAGLVRLAHALPSLSILDISECPNLPKPPSRFSMSPSESPGNESEYRHFLQRLTTLLPMTQLKL